VLPVHAVLGVVAGALVLLRVACDWLFAVPRRSPPAELACGLAALLSGAVAALGTLFLAWRSAADGPGAYHTACPVASAGPHGSPVGAIRGLVLAFAAAAFYAVKVSLKSRLGHVAGMPSLPPSPALGAALPPLGGYDPFAPFLQDPYRPPLARPLSLQAADPLPPAAEGAEPTSSSYLPAPLTSSCISAAVMVSVFAILQGVASAPFADQLSAAQRDALEPWRCSLQCVRHEPFIKGFLVAVVVAAVLTTFAVRPYLERMAALALIGGGQLAIQWETAITLSVLVLCWAASIAAYYLRFQQTDLGLAGSSFFYGTPWPLHWAAFVQAAGIFGVLVGNVLAFSLDLREFLGSCIRCRCKRSQEPDKGFESNGYLLDGDVEIGSFSAYTSMHFPLSSSTLPGTVNAGRFVSASASSGPFIDATSRDGTLPGNTFKSSFFVPSKGNRSADDDDFPVLGSSFSSASFINSTAFFTA
jgi:hypothetical protein